jgi:16S rRNA (guanine966-N2)-methyltransferase
MRLIAGEAKGRRLHAPRGLHVRPSGARLRESAFGILEHRDAIRGARVLDLFAGTGALGLEALSRGARNLLAVEQDRRVARLLGENAAACGFGSRTEIRVQPVRRALEGLAGRAGFDLVLMDPPYRRGQIADVLADLERFGVLRPGAFVLVEHAREEEVEVSGGYERELDRRYGDSRLTLLRSSAASTQGGETTSHGSA